MNRKEQNNVKFLDGWIPSLDRHASFFPCAVQYGQHTQNVPQPESIKRYDVKMETIKVKRKSKSNIESIAICTPFSVKALSFVCNHKINYHLWLHSKVKFRAQNQNFHTFHVVSFVHAFGEKSNRKLLKTFLQLHAGHECGALSQITIRVSFQGWRLYSEKFW